LKNNNLYDLFNSKSDRGRIIEFRNVALAQLGVE
jgi:hypothetical protein